MTAPVRERENLSYALQKRNIDNHIRTYAVMQCSKCPATGEINADATNRLLPIDQIERRFSRLGWSLKKNHNLCPTCAGFKRSTLKLELDPRHVERLRVKTAPVASVERPRAISPSLSHIPERDVGKLTLEQQVVWYKQAIERERSRSVRIDSERKALDRLLKPIANVAKAQFSGLGRAMYETGMSDNYGVSLSVNFKLLKDAIVHYENNS